MQEGGDAIACKKVKLLSAECFVGSNDTEAKRFNFSLLPLSELAGLGPLAHVIPTVLDVPCILEVKGPDAVGTGRICWAGEYHFLVGSWQSAPLPEPMKGSLYQTLSQETIVQQGFYDSGLDTGSRDFSIMRSFN